MSIVLYHGSGSGGFSLNVVDSSDRLPHYRQNVSNLLRVRGLRLASQLFSTFPWLLSEATNDFSDDFFVMHSVVGLEKYEEARAHSSSQEHLSAFEQIAGTISEIGPYVRFVSVSLDPEPKPQPTDSRGLTAREVEKLVYKYIGVSGGYLGDFSYQSHYEFYVGLDLDIDPNQIEGTTRVRFTRILFEAPPPIQSRILSGILERFPVNSAPIRTKGQFEEVRGWIRRLSTSAVVSVSPLRITSSVVERALLDAEQLMASTGATSGVDRAHTALHGYLLQVCLEANISTELEDGLPQLFKALRTQHAAFRHEGPRAKDVDRLLGAMATVVDTLSPLRNKASIAHPNPELLNEPEALLVINSVRTLLNYFDSKIQSKKVL